MTDFELQLPEGCNWARLPERIEAACAAEGLSLGMKGSLAKHPGCLHWHFKQGRERGTLEITLWPQQHRLWFTVQDGRRGEWIEEAVARLKPILEAKEA